MILGGSSGLVDDNDDGALIGGAVGAAGGEDGELDMEDEEDGGEDGDDDVGQLLLEPQVVIT